MGAPCTAVPLPAGRPVPSGMMVMSHGAMSAGLTGLPRLGPSAANAPAVPRPTATTTKKRLRVDMLHLTLAVHTPAGDGVEMLAWEIQHRRRLRGLSS